MSAILIKTAKGKKSFSDSHGKKREVVDATPFRTDAETAAKLLEDGGFRLARDHQVAPAPEVIEKAGEVGAASGDDAGKGTADGDEPSAIAEPEDDGTPEPVEE
jgi:hypothetical protein